MPKSYFAKMKSLEGKKVAVMATGLFPAALGRKQTLTYMKKICREIRGGDLRRGYGMVELWSREKIERLVEDLVLFLTNNNRVIYMQINITLSA